MSLRFVKSLGSHAQRCIGMSRLAVSFEQVPGRSLPDAPSAAASPSAKAFEGKRILMRRSRLQRTAKDVLERLIGSRAKQPLATGECRSNHLLIRGKQDTA